MVASGGQPDALLATEHIVGRGLATEHIVGRGLAPAENLHTGILKEYGAYDILYLENLNLAVNFYSTIGLLLLTKPMVGVFSHLNYLY